MRSKIINALLIRDVATQRTTMEKWIGHEEEGSVIPRCRGTPDRLEGFELRDTEAPTQSNACIYMCVCVCLFVCLF